MMYTERDRIISEYVQKMTRCTNAEIAEFLAKVKGIYIDGAHVEMYRPLERVAA